MVYISALHSATFTVTEVSSDKFSVCSLRADRAWSGAREVSVMKGGGVMAVVQVLVVAAALWSSAVPVEAGRAMLTLGSQKSYGAPYTPESPPYVTPPYSPDVPAYSPPYTPDVPAYSPPTPVYSPSPVYESPPITYSPPYSPSPVYESPPVTYSPPTPVYSPSPVYESPPVYTPPVYSPSPPAGGY